MARRQHNTLNDTLIHELKTEFHAHFETVFADELSKHPENYHSLRKISQSILALISINRSQLISILDASVHVKTELLATTMHGHIILKEHEKADGETILNLFIDILKNEKSDLSQVLLLHGFFIHRLYDHCPNKSIDMFEESKFGNKEFFANKIFRNSLFSERKRQEVKNVAENKNPGVISNSALAKLSRISPLTEGSPKDLLKVDESSLFVQKIRKHHLPLASSVSGHTGSLLLGAMIYGGLTKLELSEYLLAAFSYLTMARAHTFHEVMVVGETVGLPFSYHNYVSSIPSEIRESSVCQHMSNLFPQYLPKVDETQGVNLSMKK